jgi:predicted NodU family carbamoyl transferase
MNIVGVNISHDTSVCLMQDGKIIFYLEEERLCKIKSYTIKDIRNPIQTLTKLKKIYKSYRLFNNHNLWERIGK